MPDELSIFPKVIETCAKYFQKSHEFLEVQQDEGYLVLLPKLKTKSSAKKRFKITAKGKVKMPQAGKRHGMIKRTNSQIRKQRGTTVMSKQDARIVKSYMPYSLRG